MPDCEIPERMNTVYKPSLHTYLKEYIAVENELLNRFIKDNKNYVFDYSYYDTIYEDKKLRLFDNLYLPFGINTKISKEYAFKNYFADS